MEGALNQTLMESYEEINEERNRQLGGEAQTKIMKLVKSISENLEKILRKSGDVHKLRDRFLRGKSGQNITKILKIATEVGKIIWYHSTYFLKGPVQKGRQGLKELK